MILVDTHVHVHNCFDLDMFFDGAVSNFDAAAGDVPQNTCTAFLCLTDVQGIQSHVYLCESIRHTSRWRFSLQGDPLIVRAERHDSRVLYLIPGRQIVSSEGLELLALSSAYEPSDKSLPLSELIACVIDRGGVPVIPWGVGKWMGQRSIVVQKQIEASSRIVLADNGNRLMGSRRPALLNIAAERGRMVWAGSDPLPMRSHITRAGSYGVKLDVMTNPDDPASAWDLFTAAGAAPELFGHLTAPWTFLKSQCYMQIHKRRGRKC